MVPLRQQFTSLKSKKIISAQLVTVLVAGLAGHYMIYAYFTPFLQETMSLSASWISIAYLVFGFSAVIGGGLGGVLSDKLGAKKSILMIVGIFVITLAVLPFSTYAPIVFIRRCNYLGYAKLGIESPQQSYLIETAPESAAISAKL